MVVITWNSCVHQIKFASLSPTHLNQKVCQIRTQICFEFISFTTLFTLHSSVHQIKFVPLCNSITQSCRSWNIFHSSHFEMEFLCPRQDIKFVHLSSEYLNPQFMSNLNHSLEYVCFLYFLHLIPELCQIYIHHECNLCVVSHICLKCS